MRYAVIDLGSNSMRLTVFEVNEDGFKVLFKEKSMAGLAGYVEKGALSREGISRACGGLLEFKEILEHLEIRQVSVFATASLRNIDNTQEAAAAIERATGLPVEVISGEQEALYGFTGVMCDLELREGVYTDIGGASTEVAVFTGGMVQSSVSLPIGSLKLYRECVKKLLPGEGSLRRIEERVRQELKKELFSGCRAGGTLACTGGTSRAVLRLCHRVFPETEGARGLSSEQLEELYAILSRGDGRAVDLILKTDPERIHTLIPGMAILREAARKSGASELLVSKYGVREGYLCQRIRPGM